MVILQRSDKKASDEKFYELYEEISRDWQHKAKRLQSRRWQLLKQSGVQHHTAL